jgi:putative FmdB family regulatory protein
MPIYEFRCVQCGHIQEILTSRTSEEVVMKCKECEGEELERVLSQVNYAMGSSSAPAQKNSCPSATTRKCGENSCTTLQLPGYTK